MENLRLEDFELTEEPLISKLLREVKESLNKHLIISDWQGVDIILAIVAAHFIDGEPLWVRFLGPSRSGKTELLRPIAEHEDCAEIEALTPASIRGGLKGGSKLLDRLDGRLVITKDLAALATQRSEVKTEVFGLFRNIKDGKLTSDFGTEDGHYEQKASFDWIVAATEALIEQQRSLEGLLGQRFIDLRWVPSDSSAMACRAIENNKELKKSIREDLKEIVQEFIDEAKKVAGESDYELSDNERQWLVKVANAAAILRTPVQRTRSGAIRALPEVEIATDISQSFSRIALGLITMDVYPWQLYIRRLAQDCIPSIRKKILYELKNKAQSVTDLELSTQLPRSTIDYHMVELESLKAVKDNGGVKTLNIVLP